MSNPNDRTLGRMDGRVALVTGASSGIGAAIVVSFLNAGARVHAVARRGEMVAENVGPEALESGRCVVHTVDVSDRDAVLALGADLAQTDPIDTLVCAAGINVTHRRMSELTSESWEQLVATNLSGVFYSIRATLDQLRDRQGDVVLISSVTASWPDHAGGGYGATKSGVLGLARGLGIDEHMNGVRVTSILPGIVNTPILDKRPIPPSPTLREWCLQPEDVATAALVGVTMPARANIAEMTLVATRLQSLGKTQEANPSLPPGLG